METDGKRLLIAVAVAMGLMLVWNVFFPPDPPPEKDEAAEVEGDGKTDQAEGAADKKVEKQKEGTAEVEPEVARGKEQIVTLRTDRVEADFTSYGGALKSWRLTESRFDEDGKHLDMVRTTPDEGLPLEVSFTGSTFEVPKTAEWKLEQVSERELVLRWSSADLEVAKRYKLIPGEYVVELELEFKNISQTKAQQSLRLQSTSFQDPDEDTGGGMARMPMEWKSACYVGGELEEKGQKGLRKKTREWSGKVAWAGFAHSYFLTAFAPSTGDESRFTCRGEPAVGRKGAMIMTLEFPAITLSPGDPTYTWKVVGFFGPKYLDRLDGIDKLVGYKTQLREAVDLGWFEIIARPMLWLLKKFQGFVGNWAIAIILLTLVVKTLLLPWTHKSLVSMKKMSVLAPRMKEIQAKYKDDKAAQQARIMEMYKQEGVNPLSGCLPMLLQMPIWIALYRMLMKAAELYRQPMIPGWVDDLTAPDPIYILPVLLVAVMFVQAKFTPTTGGGAQQKMLKYGMPIMFGGMSFFFPAGLTLYIFTNTLLTGVHHVWLRRGDHAAKAPVASKSAAIEAQVVDVDDEPGEAESDDVGEGGSEEAEPSEVSERPAGANKKTKKKKRKKGRRR